MARALRLSTPPPIAIALDDVRVVRGGTVVLPGLSATVAAGSVTGLLGPSGSGKSTLMRAVVGVQLGVSGRLQVLGLPAGVAQLRRRVGYRPQSLSIYADLTVLENIRYFARIAGAPAGRIDEVLATVDLERYRGRVVVRLSGGEQARVSLACALVGAPELLVLDEPTVGLDPLLRRDLWRTFHELAGQGTTLLVSSHVMDEAEHCDELLLMRDGRLIATGTPAGLRERTGADDLGDAFLRLIEQGAA